jgi:hypothetical protein
MWLKIKEVDRFRSVKKGKDVLVRLVRCGHVRNIVRVVGFGEKGQSDPMKGNARALGRRSDGAANGSPTNQRPPSQWPSHRPPNEKGQLLISSHSRVVSQQDDLETRMYTQNVHINVSKLIVIWPDERQPVNAKSGKQMCGQYKGA